MGLRAFLGLGDTSSDIHINTRNPIVVGVDIPCDTSTGIWIGIDLGTTNCACAVWDSFRGSPKWLRLPNNVATRQHNGKMGRIMPSVVRWVLPNESEGTATNPVLVGAAACDENVIFKKEGSLLQSVKRMLGKTYNELDPQWLKTLDFDVLPPNALCSNFDKDAHLSVRLVARILGSDTTITTTPEEVLFYRILNIPSVGTKRRCGCSSPLFSTSYSFGGGCLSKGWVRRARRNVSRIDCRCHGLRSQHARNTTTGHHFCGRYGGWDHRYNNCHP
jgi:hypothetical protein